jgi:hypothetical protein
VSDSRWRPIAALAISRVLAEAKGRPEAEIVAALRAAYPFGQRKYHPYKVWLSEVKRQRSAEGVAAAAGSERDREMAREAFRAAGREVPAWLRGEP